jgi:hypothetical protein
MSRKVCGRSARDGGFGWLGILFGEGCVTSRNPWACAWPKQQVDWWWWSKGHSWGRTCWDWRSSGPWPQLRNPDLIWAYWQRYGTWLLPWSSSQQFHPYLLAPQISSVCSPSWPLLESTHPILLVCWIPSNPCFCLLCSREHKHCRLIWIGCCSYR